MGLTMLIAIAIGMLYQRLSPPRSGTGAPNAVLSPIEANLTDNGTATASTYQIQLTRQRISRLPIALSPATPSVTPTTTRAATRTPGAKKLCHGMAPQLRAMASRKNTRTR